MNRKLLAYLSAFVIAGYVVYLDYIILQKIVLTLVSIINPSVPRYQVYTLVRYLFYLTGAFVIFVYSAYFIFYLYFKVSEKNEICPRFFPKVSIVIPAHNEALNIPTLIESIRYQDYPPESYEILLVDDGSEDMTSEIAERLGVRVIRHETNLGKSRALERGIQLASGDIILTMDADSFLADGSTLRRIVFNLLSKPLTGISTGIVRIKEREGKLVEKFQVIEYLNSFDLGRRVQGYLDWLLVVPGAFSAFSGYFIKPLPAIPKDTLAEDFELAMIAYRAGLTSNFEPGAVVYTEPVTSFSSLYRQRIRWYYGGLQVLSKYHDMIMNGRYGERGLFLFIHMILLEYILPVLHVFGIVAFPVILLLQGLFGLTIIDIQLPNEMILLVFMLVLLFQYFPGILMSEMAMALELGSEMAIKYSWVTFLYYLIYNPLLSIAKVDSIMRFLRGVTPAW